MPIITRYRQGLLLFVLLIIAIMFVLFKAQHTKSYQAEEWYRVALKYIESYELIGRAHIGNNDNQPEGVRNYLMDRNELQSVSLPDESVLLKLLDSYDNTDNMVALVLVSERNVSSPAITDAVVKSNPTRVELVKKKHIYNYLGKLNKSQVRTHQDELMEMLHWEQNRSAIALSVALLARMESEGASSFLSDMFIGEDVNAFRTYIYYQIMSNSTVVSDLRKNLISKNMTEALDALERLETEMNTDK